MTTLTYCTNVHPGDSLADVERSLDAFTVPVARAFAGDALFPVGLFVTAATARELDSPERCARFAEFLAERRLAVATFNCFPYGGFHEARVKLEVYRPTWLEQKRVDFTLQAARVAARLAPEGAVVPISTVAGSCKLFGDDGGVHEAIACQLARVAAALALLHQESGREVVVSLEPEPFTTLETTEEAIRFFAERLHGSAARAAFVAAGGAPARCDESIARHIGLCFDTCHQAVEFEEPAAAIRRLVAAGIRIGKVQLSNALAVSTKGDRAASAALLARFNEPRWLHQAFLRDASGAIVRHLDLAEGLAAWSSASDAELRVHFHVPIDRRSIGALQTTQPELCAAATEAVRCSATSCFEVETYSLPVLPDGEERRPLTEALVAELQFARATLGCR